MKSNVTTIGIALVAVIVIVGAAIFVLNGNNSGGGGDIVKGSLPVFGNANDDDVVDD
jgi:hypothetical protein